MEEIQNKDGDRVLSLLKSLQKASKDLQNNPIFTMNKTQFSIEPFSDIDKDANTILSGNPRLIKLSQLLCSLKSLLGKLQKHQGYSLSSILQRQITNYKICQAAYAVDAEIQGYIDRESVENLVNVLEESDEEDEKVRVLVDFEKRLSRGFDLCFQEWVLKGKVFSILEHFLCDATCSMKVRNQAALAIAALIRFNKDVFVGLVLMGPTVRALISMASACSIQVVSLLIKTIRIPLVDELETYKEITRIISLLSSENVSIQVAAFDCILGIAYYGRYEAIENMLRVGLIKKLVELQRSEHGDNFPEKIPEEEEEEDEDRYVEKYPFAGCVARFAVQVEVGEMLSEEEKMEFKLEILRMVREVSVSEAESATIAAEVLWGSSPWN
ncbi:hypothetical protein SLA2020_175950 [Shorea laevis]